jgi:hypothetical protein
MPQRIAQCPDRRLLEKDLLQRSQKKEEKIGLFRLGCSCDSWQMIYQGEMRIFLHYAF